MSSSIITYKPVADRVQVYLDGKICGIIRQVTGGFAYFPKGASTRTHGEVKPSIAAVKKSLL